MNNLALNCIKEQRALGTDFFFNFVFEKNYLDELFLDTCSTTSRFKVNKNAF